MANQRGEIAPIFLLRSTTTTTPSSAPTGRTGAARAVALVDPLPLGQRRLLVSPIPAMLCRGSIQHLSSALFVWRAHFSQSMPSECEGANRSCLSQDTVTSAAPINVSLMLNCNSIRDIAAKANLSLSPPEPVFHPRTTEQAFKVDLRARHFFSPSAAQRPGNEVRWAKSAGAAGRPFLGPCHVLLVEIVWYRSTATGMYNTAPFGPSPVVTQGPTKVQQCHFPCPDPLSHPRKA